MKNILILADGSIAKHFIEWVGKKRVAENKYYVTYYKEGVTPENIPKNISLIHADPTSFSKLRNIMEDVKYSNVFIIMENMEDAEYSLKNTRLIDDKVRVVLVNQWDNDEIGRDEENITILNSDELLAAHLYDNLPNVPVVAQNVGLGRGEIMEIHVPFGSAYAYRHVGSILQRKWKIAAVYRDEKQIIPTNATMIRPNDTLLVVGKPLVLDGVYKTINKRTGLFPEPFGKDLYLLLDFRYDQETALLYLKESIYLLEKLEEKSLYVRVLYPNNFTLIDEIKALESEQVSLSICYDDHDIKTLIEYDIHQYDIGLVLNSIQTFEADELKETLYDLKKLVYLFGDNPLYNIKECVILMSENEKMESISTTAFDISESLSLKLTLGDFDPEGDFESKKMIIEHYETLTHIFNMEINIKQKVANPIREIANMKDILQIAPFEKELNTDNFMKLISTKIQDFLLTTKKHPKLLVPFAL
ncbi:MAG: hypothetical protein B6D54_03425, partial [Epsilonproteobacteria bacterium 4484_65]